MGERTAKRLNRRSFMAASLAAGTGIAVAARQQAEAKAPLTFTILHVNDLHSNFIGGGLIPLNALHLASHGKGVCLSGIVPVRLVLGSQHGVEALRHEVGQFHRVALRPRPLGKGFSGGMGQGVPAPVCDDRKDVHECLHEFETAEGSAQNSGMAGREMREYSKLRKPV
jgi:hypothetical protein